MKMKPLTQPVLALVTGTSSGIGEAVAQQLAQNGADLIITARREERLNRLAEEWSRTYKISVTVVPGDITSAETRRQLAEKVQSCGKGLNLLVNNAGAGAAAEVEQTSEAVVRDLMELNFFAPLFLTQALIPSLKEAAKQENGANPFPPTAVFLSSVVGFRGTPHYGVYGAAKSAVLTLADALRAELAAGGVNVLWAAPGTTQTEFFDRLLENRSMPHFPKHKSVSPEQAAQEILRAVISGKHRVIPHAESRILDRLNRYCPAFVDWIMTKYY